MEQCVDHSILNSILDEPEEPASPQRARSEASPLSTHFFDFGGIPLDDSELLLSPIKLGRKVSACFLQNENEFKNFQLRDDLTQMDTPAALQSSSHLVSNLTDYCFQQSGSRCVQQLIENSSAQQFANIYEQLFPLCRKLALHQFGNYVFQKLLEKPSKYRDKLIQSVMDHFDQYTKHKFGCRVVQKAIEFASLELQAQLVKRMQTSLQEVLQDPNGNHVVQRTFECLKDSVPTSFISCIEANIERLTFDSAGCRVTQKCLQHCSLQRTKSLRTKLCNKFMKLCQCQFANYLMSHIAIFGSHEQVSLIRETVKANLFELSVNKYASNVVQKMVSRADLEFREALTGCMLRPRNGEVLLSKLARNKYGNYVVKALFQSSGEESRAQLRASLRRFKSLLSQSYYGAFVLKLVGQA